MYQQYFGLKENPFALPPDPRYLYLSPQHQEALAHLLYGISSGGGFVQLTGEVGTGKTMMVRALLERLPDKVDVALVLYPFLSVREFLLAILDDLRVPRPADPTLKALIDTLNACLLDNHAQGRRTVLIVDEAHKLSRELLEQIRLLTNLETTKDKLLQIVLVGQPELGALLAQRDLRQLAQRITARYHLQALRASDTSAYILHRLRVAGAQLPLFTALARRRVHQHASGVPRLINVLCDRALLGAYARSGARVGLLRLEHAARELASENPQRRAARAWRAAAAVATLAVVAGLAWLRPAPLDTWWPSARVATRVPAATPAGVAGAPASAPADAAATRLAAALADPAVATDTDSAFLRLFAHWRLDYAGYAGATGCERAHNAGLRCLFESGTWNNLRQLNRPAIVELVDAAGTRHHVLVTGLNEQAVTLELAGRHEEFALADVDRLWFGKYLALWKPPVSGERVLRRGMRGPAIVWVREALARYGLARIATPADEAFDAGLEYLVREFQRRHQLADDGVIGKMTLMHLSAYGPGATPQLAAAATATVAR